MGNKVSHPPSKQEISYPRFAAFYTWMTDRPAVRRWEDPLRREIVGQARGIVLEVGAGGGQNFPFYDAHRVMRVEATEPEEAMLVVARRHLGSAPVPITLTDTAVGGPPFPAAQCRSAGATPGFCWGCVPIVGLTEVSRAREPAGCSWTPNT